MSGTLKRNTYWVLLGQFLQMALALAVVPVATRYLGDEKFGVYSLAGALMYFTFLLNDLGLNTYCTREIARDPRAAPRWFAHALALKLATVLLSVLFLPAIWLIPALDHEARWAVVIFCGYGVLSSFFQLSFALFRAHERMGYETLILVAEKIITSGLGIALLFLGHGLTAFCSVFVAGGLFSLVFGLGIIHKKFFPLRLSFDRRFAREVLIRALPFGLSMFLVTVYDRVDILMLSAMTTPQEVGWYAAAYKLLSLTNLVPTIFVTALFPALSREAALHSEEAARIFTRGVKYLVFLALPMIAGATLLADELVVFAFGADFRRAAPALRILSWVSGILFLNVFLAALLNAANHQKKLLAVQIAGLLANVGLNYALIPKYSIAGSAMATVITEGLILVFCLLFALIRVTRLLEFSFIPKAILATAGMVVFCWYARDYGFLLVLPGATAVYFALLYALRGFRFNEFLLTRPQASSS